MCRILAVAIGLAAAAAQAASVRFVSPQEGSQAAGPMAIEIETDAANVDRVEFFVDGVLAGVARRPPYRIAHDFGFSLEARLVTAKVFSGGYRHRDSASIRTAPIGAGETLIVDYVEVPLRIYTKRKPSAGDLRVMENGVEQPVRDLRADRGPATFFFIIDRSLSMDDGRLDAALRAIDEARTLLRPDDGVSAVLFNHNVTKARAVASGESLASLFGTIVPSGGTSLRDAVASIPERQRTYAFVITDGGDRNSLLGEEEALRKTSGTRTVISAIVFGRAGRFLERAATNSGGRVIEASPA
ncbi:MAG TPA: Ig-like domain-containing protein, partial [Thermoanaerobaculia bacterium]|nr:Ig-like domain-containing protein [Thermoanaerobaculia bacterium]